MAGFAITGLAGGCSFGGSDWEDEVFFSESSSFFGTATTGLEIAGFGMDGLAIAGFVGLLTTAVSETGFEIDPAEFTTSIFKGYFLRIGLMRYSF